jgi:hypothetical protein
VIPKLLLELIELILDGISLLIPDVDLPSSVTTLVDDFGPIVVGYLFALNGLLPVAELATFAGWVMTLYLPAAVTYAVVRWLYSHIPVLGKGG